MRYAHLAQQHKHDAVERLVNSAVTQSGAGADGARRETSIDTATDTHSSDAVHAERANVN